MPFTDFTLNNPLIKDFLDGRSNHVPSSELIYVHSHFISNNFLSEIEVLTNMVTLIFQEDTKKAKRYAPRILSITEQLGQILPKVNTDTAPQILYLLRDLYQSLTTILKEYEDANNVKE